MGMLIGVFLVAIFMDWRYYRIPNWCVFTGAAAGLVMTCVSCPIGSVLESLADMLLVFIAFYPFYLLGGIGAGDIKLFMMTGCYIRGSDLFSFLFVAMAIGAAASIIKMAVFQESRERLFYLGRYLMETVQTQTIGEYRIDKSQKRSVIRLSLPAFISLGLLLKNRNFA